jgi:hypothetical protein
METAVEWLNNQIECISIQVFDGFLTFNEFMEQREALFKKAKAMEKEQIRIAYMEGAFEKMRHLDGKKFTMPTDYYNETFKSE